MRILSLVMIVGLVGFLSISCNITPSVLAVIQAFPPRGQAPLLVEFDGTKSMSAHGTIVAYHWDFADGATSTSATAEHTFVKPGAYRVKLRVTDSVGKTDEAHRFIEVTSTPMPMTLGTDWRVQSFQGLESCGGPDNDASGRAWYDTAYDDASWIELPLHDGSPFNGTNRDFFFRTPIDRVTPQVLRRMEISANIVHNGAIEVWINGQRLPALVFGRSDAPACHVDTGNQEVSGLINDYLEPDKKNVMAIHLSSGPSKQAQPFLQVVLWMTSK